MVEPAAVPGSGGSEDPPLAQAGEHDGDAGNGRGQGCTQAQLRRFIKSRPYVPMHELRRRFDLNGSYDDVHPISTREGTIWIGLPPRESGFLAELLRGGEIGVELCHDPCVSVVVGVYAMRPVAR
jgi:hypothetical protein